MIEWNSATLPQGFWYADFEFVYLHNETFFSAGKDLDYPGGRDSTGYMLAGQLLYGVSSKLTLGANIPVVLDQKVDSGSYGRNKRIKSGISNIGDIQLFLKYHIFDRYFWSLATELGPTLPTGKPYNKVSAKQVGTGGGQVDLNFALKGDILIDEESFVKLGAQYSYQFKREYRNKEDELIKDEPGDFIKTEAGVIRNYKSFGMGGALEYDWWQATKWNNQVVRKQSDLFAVNLLFSIGEVTPRKHGTLNFYLDFPLTGRNSPATYRIGVSFKSIFK